jgi:hypothetical protein
MKKARMQLPNVIKAIVVFFIRIWPWGYLCDFHWGAQGRIRLTKYLFVIVSNGDNSDTLPINLVSQELVDRIVEEMNNKWYAPTVKTV